MKARSSLTMFFLLTAARCRPEPLLSPRGRPGRHCGVGRRLLGMPHRGGEHRLMQPGDREGRRAGRRSKRLGGRGRRLVLRFATASGARSATSRCETISTASRSRM